MLNHLYERYGRLIFQLEILQEQIAQCKKMIIEEQQRLARREKNERPENNTDNIN